MFYFPQLSSGATGQFPITRQRTARTVVNQSWQGYQVKLADPAAAITDWHLSFAEMSDQELAALEALFQAVEGRQAPLDRFRSSFSSGRGAPDAVHVSGPRR